MTKPLIPPADQNDDSLLDELIYWVKVGRNEGDLKGEEKEYFKEVCTEVKKRKLLKISR
jgi:hypothetical protein